jgi:competence protein ComEC
MKNDFLVAISIAGFISAIFLCSFIKFGITFSFFLIFLSIIIFLFRKFVAIDTGSRKKILLITIFIFSFAIGIIRYEIKDSVGLDTNLENNVGNKVLILGIISEEPAKKEKQAILIVDFKNLVLASSTIDILGKGIVSTDLYPELKYGDLIKAYGILEKPENFSNSNASTTNPSQMKSQFDGTSFDYVSYLGKDNIFYQIKFANVEIISSGHGNAIKSFLFNLKNSFVSNLNKTIVEPESSLMSGILLGAKNSIDKNTTEVFRKAGLSHIVALSGYNITVVADGIMKVFSFLPYTIGFLGGITGIILFIVMVQLPRL